MSTESRSRSPLAFLLLGLLIMASLASIYWAAIAALADLRQLASRHALVRLQNDPNRRPSLAELGSIRNDFNSALMLTPGDPQLLEQFGFLYGVRADMLRQLPEIEKSMLDEAIAYFRRSLVRRPMSAYAWANLSFALSRRDKEADRMWEAYTKALRYGERERKVQQIAATVLFSRWDQADASLRQAFFGVFQRALPENQQELLTIARRYGHEAELQALLPKTTKQ